MLNVKKLLTAKPKAHGDQALKPLLTPWGQQLLETRGASAADAGAVPLAEHPRPQAWRETWQTLNGLWTCVFEEGAPAPEALPLALAGKKPPKVLADGVFTGEDEAAALLGKGFYEKVANLSPSQAVASSSPSQVLASPSPIQTSASPYPIRVPFSPEAILSGVNRQLQPTELLWYQRSFDAPDMPEGWRLVLHFEAVDYACAVWLNDRLLGTHVGGYLPFSFDITDAVVGKVAPDATKPRGSSDASTAPPLNQLRVCVSDPSDAGTQPRGKQRLSRGDIWCTAQGGIWQPVWLEWMPADGVGDFSLDASFDCVTGSGILKVTCEDAPSVAATGTEGALAAEDPFGVTVRLIDAQGSLVAQGVAIGTGAIVTLQVEAVHPWSPDDPYLYQVELSRGEDVVRSYCGFRTVEVRKAPDGHKRVFLNGKKVFLKGVLDQGYWPDGLMTAPSDDALVHDIATMKAAGFNLLRKHIKVENARWYYHADRLGMLVWQDMVCGGSAQNIWHTSYKPTLFKASWNSYRDTSAAHQKNLQAGDPAYRKAWTQQMAGTIKLLRSHPSIISWVLFNEGWGQFDARKAWEAARKLDPTRPINAVTGWYDQHCGDYKSVHNYFRDQAVWPDKDRKRAFVVGEFGGLTLAVPGHMVLDEAYGYETFLDGEVWRGAVRELLDQMAALEGEGLAGYVYTQLSDVEEEVNGLLTYDRRVNKLE